MKFSLTIPEASTMRVGKEIYVGLPAGTELHRVHQHIYPPAGFNPSPGGDARFSPIRDASGAVIPTLYGGKTFECAVCEIILRCPDTPPAGPAAGLVGRDVAYPSDYAAHDHSVIQTTKDLRLVDLRTNAQRLIGVNHNALLAGPRSTYPMTRGWAEKIHAVCPDAQGLYYSSYQWGPDFAVMLFGDRVPAGVLTPLSNRAVADTPCHDAITALADQLSIDYVDA